MVCFEGLPCLRSKSKCFTNFIVVSELDFNSALNQTILIRCNFTQWRSHWGSRGVECHPWQQKICQKPVKRGVKSEKIGEKEKKIGKVLSLCPSWQIGLATLLVLRYFLLWAILEHSTQYKQCFIVTWVNISDDLLCPVCSDGWKCVAPLAVKRLIYAYTWHLLMQCMVLQIMGSNDMPSA